MKRHFKVYASSNRDDFSQLLQELISSVKDRGEREYGFNIEVKQTKTTITWYAYEGSASSDNLVGYITDDLTDYKQHMDSSDVENWAYSIVEELANDNSGELHRGPKF